MAGNEILAVGDEAQAEYEQSQTKDENTTEVSTDSVETTPTDTVVEKEVTEGDKSVEEPKEDEVTGYFFGDQQVEVEVPSDISAALKEHKIDEASLLKELFAKDGEFKPSEATRKALDKAFGKAMVDGYLGLFQEKNKMSMESFAAKQAEEDKQLKANSEDFEALTGGDDGWAELTDWASENLSEGEITQFNAVMNLPMEHYVAQRAVVEALQLKRLAGIGDTNGHKTVRLLSDEGSQSSGGSQQSNSLPQSLTREEFQSLFSSERYRKDPKWAESVDAVRRNTQKNEAKSKR